ncbi:MAG TPA: FAD-dependent oxidoreductase, partial [Phenylobacterium sp.]|nr:FAD-dependent oxidoreductase [Phenylobacterium sp.]
MILGGGFAGLAAARALKGAPCRVTLVDRQNHHCFQPLLYQAATAALTANDVAWPIREILGRQANLDILMDEVQGLDPEARQVRLSGGTLDYDRLIMTVETDGSVSPDDAVALGARILQDQLGPFINFDEPHLAQPQ